jgi:ABC-type transport system involved in multi-copper enzyme maturation permease subunit
MKIRAIILDTARELVYRKTLLFYFGLVTLTHLLLLLALQTDVANGVISSVRVFGMEGRATPGGFAVDNRQAAEALGLQAETLVRGTQIVIAWILYPIGILLSVFATASLVPHMLEKGSIDLLLSKPISRPALLGARYLGALLVAGANLVYLVAGVGVVLALKTGVWNWGFLLSGLLMTAYFGALLAFLVLVGVLLRSTTIGIMMTAVIYFVSLVIYFPHENADWPMLLTSPLSRYLTQAVVEILYHVLPRTYALGQLITALILHRPIVSWTPVFATIGSGAVALVAAILWFRRLDF